MRMRRLLPTTQSIISFRRDHLDAALRSQAVVDVVERSEGVAETP